VLEFRVKARVRVKVRVRVRDSWGTKLLGTKGLGTKCLEAHGACIYLLHHYEALNGLTCAYVPFGNYSFLKTCVRNYRILARYTRSKRAVLRCTSWSNLNTDT